jgi:hypothetical protein
MRSGYQMRQWQRQEDRDDQACPRCKHRMGGHRDMPGRCVECPCVISFDDLAAWRREGKLAS